MPQAPPATNSAPPGGPRHQSPADVPRSIASLPPTGFSQPVATPTPTPPAPTATDSLPPAASRVGQLPTTVPRSIASLPPNSIPPLPTNAPIRGAHSSAVSASS